MVELLVISISLFICLFIYCFITIDETIDKERLEALRVFECKDNSGFAFTADDWRGIHDEWLQGAKTEKG